MVLLVDIVVCKKDAASATTQNRGDELLSSCQGFYHGNALHWQV